MASDNLKQLGKRLRKTKKDTEYVRTNVSQNFPVVEGSSDIFGAINTYIFEFKTYNDKTSVYLDVIIREKFRGLG